MNEFSTSPMGACMDAKDNNSPNYGTATQYWLELVPSPNSISRNLWLYVNGAWRHLDDPCTRIETLVQDAFANPEELEVIVWYTNVLITGLVIRSKD